MYNINCKKIFTVCLVFVSLLLVGCSKDISKKITNKKEKTKIEEKYLDSNDMKIGIYQDNNGKLSLLDGYSDSFVRGTDIAVFQLFPSNDKEIVLNKKFGEEFYNKWSSLSKNNKIGFNFKYSLNDGTNFSYNAFNPDEVMLHAEYLEVYLYDDYLHRNDSFYSHVESKNFNDSTLFTSIKLTPGMKVDDIKSPIKLTVFTYDSQDDFDPKTNKYRGNSKYSIDVTRTN